MAETIEILLPIPEVALPVTMPSPRLDDLRGRVLGLIHNGWRSLGVTYEEWVKTLTEKYGVAATIEKRKSASSPLPEADLEELAMKADVVITGLGN